MSEIDSEKERVELESVEPRELSRLSVTMSSEGWCTVESVGRDRSVEDVMVSPLTVDPLMAELVTVNSINYIIQ